MILPSGKVRDYREWLISSYTWKQWYLNFTGIPDFLKSKSSNHKNINYYEKKHIAVLIWNISEYETFLRTFFSLEVNNAFVCCCF